MVDTSPSYDPDSLETRLRNRLGEDMYHCIEVDNAGYIEVEFLDDVSQEEAREMLRDALHEGTADDTVMAAVSYSPLRYSLV